MRNVVRYWRPNIQVLEAHKHKHFAALDTFVNIYIRESRRRMTQPNRLFAASYCGYHEMCITHSTYYPLCHRHRANIILGTTTTLYRVCVYRYIDIGVLDCYEIALFSKQRVFYLGDSSMYVLCAHGHKHNHCRLRVRGCLGRQKIERETHGTVG